MPAVSPRTISMALKATAVLNIGAGLAALAAPDLHATLMLAPDSVLEGLVLRYHVMMWGFVVVMGLGYAVAARNPEEQTALILAGGVGKLLAAGVWLEMLASGLGAPLMLGGILFDGSLGVLFLVFVVPRLLADRG